MIMDISDHPAVVVTTYLFALIPWAIVQSTDFIGKRWKTVKETRQHGYFQLFVSCIPLLFVIPYIFLQILARDFKEMSTAVVAIFFALLHIARTSWGLVQVHEFRQWAVLAIQTLESHNITCEVSNEEREKLKSLNTNSQEEWEWKADHVEINETIVDNQIFGGDTPCDLIFKFGDHDFNFFEFLRKVGSCSYSKVSALFLCLGKRVRCPSIKQKPRYPTEVWIRWTVSFAAQRLGTWIENVDVSPDASVTTHNGDVTRRQILHAGEILSAACLLQFDPKESDLKETEGGVQCQFSEGHPLQWDRLSHNGRAREEASFCNYGKISRKELLLRALSSESRLPFQERLIPTNLDHNTHDRDIEDIEANGFQSYQHNMQRVAESVPAKFGNSVKKFGFKQLEYLTILLNAGPLVSFKHATSSRETFGFDKHTPAKEAVEDNDITTDKGNSNANFSNQDQENTNNIEHDFTLAEDKVSVMNLKSQLGISTFSPEILKVADTSNSHYDQYNTRVDSVFLSPLPLPISEKGQKRLFRRNKNVLEVSGLIDINFSLQAGSFMKRVEKGNQDPGIFLESLRLPYEKIEAQSENDNKLLDAQNRLEQVRLAAGFNIYDTTCIHEDQTLSFLGVAMEAVRSALQRGIREENEEEWCPEIAFSDGKSISAVSLEFSASKSLSDAITNLKGPDGSWMELEKFLEKRTTQVRLVWELQNACLQNLKESTTPRSEIAMMGCLLAFPSLYCESRTRDLDFPVKGDGDDIQITIERWDCLVLVIPAAGPQKLHVSTRIKENGSIEAKIERRDTSCDSFHWSDWRDAFNGRLQGSRAWKRENGLEVVKGCITTGDITGNVKTEKLADTRVTYELWEGWLPHTPRICDFRELEEMTTEEKTRLEFNEDPTRREAWRARIVKTVEEREEMKSQISGPELWMRVGRVIIGTQTRSVMNFFRSAVLSQTHATEGTSEGLEVVMKYLCNENSDLNDLLTGLSFIRVENELYPVKDEERLALIRKWLFHLICYSNYYPETVCTLSQLERGWKDIKRVIDPKGENSITDDIIRFLRVSYMRHGKFSTLREILKFCDVLGHVFDKPSQKKETFTKALILWTSWLGFCNETLKSKEKEWDDATDEDHFRKLVPECMKTMLQDSSLSKVFKAVYEYQIDNFGKKMKYIRKWLRDDPVAKLTKEYKKGVDSNDLGDGRDSNNGTAT